MKFKIQNSKFKSWLNALIGLCLMFTVSFSQTACEQKTLEHWAENALVETDAAIALAIDPTGLIQFKEKLQTFIAHAKTAKTLKERAALLIEFSEVVSLFRETVAPAIPPDSPAGQKLLKVDELLKNISRKVSCLIANARDSPEFTGYDIMQAKRNLDSYAAE